MSEKLVISLDIGGTNIDGALVSSGADIVGEVHSIKSVSDQSYDAAVANLLDFIRVVQAQTELPIAACSIGMPRPFDYENGISHMKHKFTSLYGKNIKEPLEDGLDVPVLFVNDADAFALGAYWKQVGNAGNLIGVTIGTGLGSGFIEDGRVVSSKNRVPENGEIWDLPYRGGILEDFVSGKGIENIYRRSTGNSLPPKAIEDLAKQGDVGAQDAYREMGVILGDGLALACHNFVPDRVVIGGKLGRAAMLFAEETSRQFHAGTGYDTRFVQAESELLALYGPAKYAFDLDT
ncbi:MAG TPA: ROK family protein [Candidatus Saccharimonadales bacterium]|nr:ROK family protein [Candidatus Saccharimonadales bacterium]